jgi:hypothetical protein
MGGAGAGAAGGDFTEEATTNGASGDDVIDGDFREV